MLAARDLDAVANALRSELGLGKPFADPGVAYFGLRNAVFALGDTFLEVVSPVRSDASAARLIDRRGGDCGYMLMFQVDDLDGARSRARDAAVREVFEVSLDDIAEVHLHPGDMRGAIVSLSEPRPPAAWRWGGPDWEARSAEGVRVAGARVALPDADSVQARWASIIGALPGVEFEQADEERGVVEIRLASDELHGPFEVGGIRFNFEEVRT